MHFILQISQKTVSGLLGVSCGVYSVNEDHLVKRMEMISANLKHKNNTDLDVPPEKRSKNLNEVPDMSLAHESMFMSYGDVIFVFLSQDFLHK